jgi:ABC-type multidrug transport system fused ATPase/permease subunit
VRGGLRHVLRSGLTALGRDRRLLALACAAALVTGVLETAMLYLMGTVAVAMTNGTNRADVSPGPFGTIDLSIGAAVALAGAALAVLVVVSIPAARLLGMLSSRASVRLRTRLVRNYLQTSIAYRATHREGYVEQLVGEYGQLADLAVVQVVTLIVSLCTLSILLVAAVLASPLAALGAVAVLTLSTLALRPLTTRTARFSQRSQAVNAEVVSRVGQATRLSDEIAAFAVGGAVAADLERDIARSGAYVRRIRAEQRLIPALYQYSGLASVLILIGLLVVLEPDGLPALAPLILLLIRALMYMRQTIIASRMAAELVPYVDALDAELAQMRAHREPQEGVERAGFDGLALRGVSFAYGKDTPVLVDVDLELRTGEMLGVVGASGSGKSTLSALLLRLRAPTAGTILAGDVALADVAPAAWARLAAYVPQDSRLIRASVADNIRFFRPAFSDDDVRAAARAAHLEDEILALPEGYATEIGPGARDLSGGQRQRLAIARALLQRPRLLVLDEPTSALDAHSEQLIGRTLAELKGATTIVLIAHRPATLELCDRIVEVVGGTVRELPRAA